jgi:cobalt-precorrin 5A hydrolase
MKIGIFAITEKGAALADTLARELPGDFFLPESVEAQSFQKCRRYTEKLSEFVPKVFNAYEGFVFVMAVGIVVRMVGRCAESKFKDPAVVVVDEAGRYAISLLSGHEGGANKLAHSVAMIAGAEPVVTTATEANKKIVVGVGCRRGVPSREIVTAVTAALERCSLKPADVRVVASITLKRNEAGLIAAAEEMGIPLRFFRTEEIAEVKAEYSRSEFVKEKIGVEGVCEPCALLAGRSAHILLPKTVFGQVTVAVAEEKSLWSA